MTTSRLSQALHNACSKIPRDGAELNDGQLLENFIIGRDPAALEALVGRHAPMVWGVCRRTLRNYHDAEDAFQAAFLVLVRKASSIRSPAMVGNWLYGVARQTALKARATRAKRRAREEQTPAGVEPVAALADPSSDLSDLLDIELTKLPDKYHSVLILCGLQGKSLKEAARRLDLPEGTVASRLARGRAMLAKRLVRHGLAVSGVSLAALQAQQSASASVSAAAISSTIKAATAAGAVSANVGALANGVLKAMLLTKLMKTTAAALVMLAVLGVGVMGWAGMKPEAQPPASPSKQQAKKDIAPMVDETAGQRAKRLALTAHSEASAIGKLPQFSCQVSYRHGVVDSMRVVDVSLELLKAGLTAPVLDKDWLAYQTVISWDEKRFVWELNPQNDRLNYDFRFWTANDAWARHEKQDKSSVLFTRRAGPDSYWKNMPLFDFCYLRFTPLQFWWGQTVDANQTMSLFPPVKASWNSLETEEFGGETCDVVESPERPERLWISQHTGHVRGVLSYHFTGFPGDDVFWKTDAIQAISGKKFASRQEYYNWHSDEATEKQLMQAALVWYERCSSHFPANTRMNELVRFDDYQEIKPGVWLPQREVRVVPYRSKSDESKWELCRMELSVEQVKTDRNLTGRYAELLPKEGQHVQDQRFLVPVDYNYSSERTDDDIVQMATEEYSKRLKGQEQIKRLLQPLDAMVGKAAPVLPATGWIGGQRPELAGRPYLLHFWATWCGPCKNDLPRLKALAAKGAIIIGMHPAGTPAEEIEKVIHDQKLGYSTFLAVEKDADAKNPRIGGYPTGVFPYCIVVDAEGKVARHGFLSDLLGKSDLEAQLVQRKDAEK